LHTDDVVAVQTCNRRMAGAPPSCVAAYVRKRSRAESVACSRWWLLSEEAAARGRDRGRVEQRRLDSSRPGGARAFMLHGHLRAADYVSEQAAGTLV
jgi:hypothetical protein